MEERVCELCKAKAAIFCLSDAAFLHWSCDAKVLASNFLAARHIRQPVCLNNGSISVVGFDQLPFSATCPSDDLNRLSSNSSVRISSTSTSPMKEYSSGLSRMDSRGFVSYFKAEGIVVNWCRKLGPQALHHVGAVRMALLIGTLSRVCVEQWPGFPFRVCLAASLWHGLRLGQEKTWQILKRLEEISGYIGCRVDAGACVHSCIFKARQLMLEEGWDESKLAS